MARTIVHTGRIIQDALDELTHEDGRPYRRDVVLHPGAVVILPLLDGERVVLLRNYRHAVGGTLWEVPAGTLEPPEPPEACAVRELIEETGYRAKKWRKLAEFYPSPGILSERMYLFAAEELTPGEMALEAANRSSRTWCRGRRRSAGRRTGRSRTPRRWWRCCCGRRSAGAEAECE